MRRMMDLLQIAFFASNSIQHRRKFYCKRIQNENEPEASWSSKQKKKKKKWKKRKPQSVEQGREEHEQRSGSCCS